MAGRLGMAVVIGLVCIAATTGCADDGGVEAADIPAAVGADQTDDDAGSGQVDVTLPVRPEVVIPDSWPSAVDEVYGRYWLYWEAFAAAHAPPGADPQFTPLRTLSTERNWVSLTDQLSRFAADDLVLVQPPNSITQHLLRAPDTAVLAKAEGAELILQDCWIDDFVQQTLDGRVVSEAREAKLMNVVMRVVDGEWRVDGVTRATDESDGYEQCVTLLSP